jgi:hypothetical protein
MHSITYVREYVWARHSLRFFNALVCEKILNDITGKYLSRAITRKK